MSGSNQLAFGVPTIASSGAPQVANPLAAINAANEAASHMYDLRAKQAKEAAGQAYQGAINPQTGELDANDFRRRLAASGPAAIAAGESLLNIQTISSNQLDQMKAKAAWTSHNAGVLADMPNPTQQDAINVLHKGLTDGILTPAEFQRQVSQLPTDPAGLRNWAAQHRANAQTVEQQIQWRYGVPFKQTGPGGQTIGGTQDVKTGAVSGPPQPGLPLGRSPDSSGQYIVIKENADGTKLYGTAQHALNLAEGRDINDNGPHVPGGTGQTSPLGTGRLPPALQNPNKPPAAAAPAAAPAATAPAPAPTGGVQSGQTTSGSAAATTTGTTSANRFTEIVDQGVKARSQDALLATLLSEAQGIRTGPGLDFVTGLKRTILGAGAQFGSNFGIDETKLAKLESVIKIGNQLADAQGAGSDARLRVNEGANPSYHNTPAGLDLIVRQLRGNSDYLRARQQLAAAYPGGKDKIEDFEAKIGANLDPRVFQYERLTPEQKADYFKGLTDKDTFIRAHDWATGQKLLGRGG